MRIKRPPTFLLVTTFVASFVLADIATAGPQSTQKRGPDLLELRFSTSATPARGPAMVVPIPSQGSRTFSTSVTAPVTLPDGVTRRCKATLDREPDSPILSLRLECGAKANPQVAVRTRFRAKKGRAVVLAGFAAPSDGSVVELAVRVR